MKQALQNTGIQ